MKIFSETESFGRFSLLTEVEAYDAVTPISRFFIDYVPSVLNPERVALAGYLAFGSWISGGVKFPEAICPELASAIEDDSMPARVRPEKIDYTPKRLAGGKYEAQVLVGPAATESETSRSLRILPHGKYVGALRQEGHLQVSSNAYVLAGCVPKAAEHRPMLAVAVLAAEEFGIEKLRFKAKINENERMHLQSLLGAVGLGLTIC